MTGAGCRFVAVVDGVDWGAGETALQAASTKARKVIRRNLTVES